jgi:hypothetical protein
VSLGATIPLRIDPGLRARTLENSGPVLMKPFA